MSRIKLALMAGLIAAGVSAGFGGGAQAMPIANLGTVDTAAAPEEVRWVCNRWGRCWWQPNRLYGPYAYYRGPRVYGGPRFYGGPRWHGPRWRYRTW